ncbi:MAG TPA: YciI family protein [Gaiellaceae bacterium]|nr:YciI family protein [Gaiellaceae bacterium]
MEFLALIHGDENGWAAMSDEERQAVYQRYTAFSERPEVVGGAELQETTTATTVRVRNGDSVVTDGPYAEVKEALGGFFILEADSIDDACRLAAEIPAAEHGAVEVRPVYVREES